MELSQLFQPGALSSAPGSASNSVSGTSAAAAAQARILPPSSPP